MTLPTVEGRALADLSAQLQAARAEVEAPLKSLESSGKEVVK